MSGVSERLSAEERDALTDLMFAGDFDDVLAEFERILAAHLADMEARLAALANEIEDPRVQRPGMQRRRLWAARIRRAALHPDPSEQPAQGDGGEGA